MSENESDSVAVEELFDDRLEMMPKSKVRVNARNALVDIAISRAVDRDLRRRICSKKARAIVIQVPDAGWVEPILGGVDQFLSGMITVSRPTVPTPKSRNDFTPSIARALGSGRTVAGASPDPDRALPELLLSVSDTRITIEPVDAEFVLECIRRCLRGRLPPEAGVDLNPQSLSFEELVSLVGQSSDRAEAVAKVRAAISNKNASDRASLPLLEDAIEYGEAREWALNLRDDIRDAVAGKISWDQVDRGVCLYGPPGTGKTLLGQMLGQACGIPTVVGSIGELFASSSGYLDGVIKALRKLFDDAKAKAPAILFIDELNGMPRVDGLGRNADFWKPLILELYTLLDGAVNDRSGVVVVGAANMIDEIHPALLRPGRLERAIFVGPPDAAGAERIFRYHLGADLVGVDIGYVARIAASHSSTGAVIMEKVRASRRTARRAGRSLELADLEAQVCPPDERPPEYIRRVAVHEAGHAIAALAVGGIEVGAVSIIGQHGAGGITQFVGHGIRNDMTKSELENSCLVMMAGRAAEHLMLGDVAGGSGGNETSDLGVATRIATMMLGGLGMGEGLTYRTNYADALATLRIDRDLRAAVDQAMEEFQHRAITLLTEFKPKLELLTAELLKRRFMTGRQVEDILWDDESKAEERVNSRPIVPADRSSSPTYAAK